MNEPVMTDMRSEYSKSLIQLGKENPNIVVLGADTTDSLKTSGFGKEFPDRFFNVGIAEANLTTISAGLAVLWNVVKDSALGNKEKLELIHKMDEIFGLGLDKVEEKQFEVPEDIKLLALKRWKAKQAKNWAEADKLRYEIEEKGFAIKDEKDSYKIIKK